MYFSTEQKLAYIREHVQEGNEVLCYTFVVLNKDMKVFKNVRCGGVCIANLVIPSGSLVYIGANDFEGRVKCRATQAYVHSIVHIGNKRSMNEAFSFHDRRFRYVQGKFVFPHKFSYDKESCQGGIHFFTTLEEALDY